MNWLNIHTSTLRSPEVIGSSPVERATWLLVLAHCVEQENGGKIEGALAWKCRQWQQTCGVTLREIRASSRLLRFDGDDLICNFYPHSKEEEVKNKREAGRAGGVKSGEARSKHSFKQSGSTASPGASTEGKGKDKGIGKEGEGNGSGASSKALAAIPQTLSDVPGFLSEWENFKIHRRRIGSAMTKRAEELILGKLCDRADFAIGGLQLAMERGWTGFEWEWFDNSKAKRGQKPTEAQRDQSTTGRQSKIEVPLL